MLSPGKISSWSFLFALVSASLVWPPALRADTINAASVDDHGGVLVSSDADRGDPLYDRDQLGLSLQVVHERAFSFSAATYDYRITVRLLDGDGSSVLLGPAFPATSRTFTQTVVFGGSDIAVPRTYNYRVVPFSRLNWGTSYRLHAVFSRRLAGTEDAYVDVGERTTIPFRVAHFNSRDPADAARNVLSEVTAVRVTRDAALDGEMDGRDRWEVEVDYRLLRYDNWQAILSLPTNVDLDLIVGLRRTDTGAPINLADQIGQTNLRIEAFTFDGEGRRAPSAVTGTIRVTFRTAPSQRLDSVNRQYIATVTPAHAELADGTRLNGRAAEAEARRFLHFNGRLFSNLLATTITRLSADPTWQLSGVPGTIRAALPVAVGGGTVDSIPGSTFGSGAVIQVSLDVLGNARVFSGVVPVTLPVDRPVLTAEGVRFALRNLTLSANGPVGATSLWLPAGAGLGPHPASATWQTAVLDLPAANLTAALAPSVPVTVSLVTLVVDNVDYGPTWLTEETKPVSFRTSSVTWDAAAGALTFAVQEAYFVRAERDAYLASVRDDLTEPAAVPRASNDGVWASVVAAVGDVVLRTDAVNASARLNASLNLGNGDFRSHFPLGTQLIWNAGGAVAIVDDAVDPSASSLGGVAGQLTYRLGCAEGEECDDGAMGGLIFVPLGAQMGFSEDGGLVAPVQIAGSPSLGWGRRPDGRNAHGAGPWSAGRYFMPGSYLEGTAVFGPPAASSAGPGTLYLRGRAVAGGAWEDPGTVAYRAGLGDYAGLNFRAADVSAAAGLARLAGAVEAVPFTLSTRSKYAVRQRGVTGIHEATPAGFPPALSLAGYPFQFDFFGLQFVGNRNTDSRTAGLLSVPFPSEFSTDFDRLTFTCQGAPSALVVPAGTTVPLAYWQAQVDLLGLHFASASGDPCRADDAVLIVGARLQPALFTQPISGLLPITATGEIGTLAASLAGHPGRLVLPASFGVAGPAGQTYPLRALGDAYFNDYANRPAAGPASDTPGFLAWAASVDVPFFVDLIVHAHVAAAPAVEGAPPPTVHFMGGFSIDEDFNLTERPDLFDGFHLGYPQADGVDVAGYRAPDTLAPPLEADDYRVFARQQWLGVVDFRYPLRWNATTRAFRSPDTLADDLLVLRVSHQVRHLDARNAELVFGASYDGLPRLNVTNILLSEVEGQLGVAEAFANAAGDQVRDRLEAGLDSVAGVLDDRLHDLFRAIFDDLADPLIATLVNDVVNPRLRNFNGSLEEWDQQVALVRADGQALRNQLKARITGLADQVDDQISLVGEIDARLESLEAAIAALRGQVPEGAPPLGFPGLLSVDPGTGRRGLLLALAAELAGDFAGVLIDEALREPLAAILAEAEPTLEELDRALAEVGLVVANTRAELASVAGGFATELRTRVRGAETELHGAVDAAYDAFELTLEGLPRSGRRFEEVSGAELQAQLRAAFEQEFFAGMLVRDLQAALRGRLYEVDAGFRRTVDSVFQQVGDTVREGIARTVGAAEGEINGFLDTLGDTVGAGRIDGFAHIQGDALRLLRLDGEFQVNLPDAMTFAGYLEIRQLDSSTPGACAAPAGVVAPEVHLGADRVPLTWLSPGMRADIALKFAVQVEPTVRPAGFGGSLVLREGSLGFETFTIDRLAAAMAATVLGDQVTEAYLSAAVGLRFGSYDLFGGIFLGRTCTLDPIALWDPEVAAVLGQPPFTGGYVYGQGWIPIVGNGCFFNVSAGVGAGVFFFVEGPTYGGKIFGGVSGEALCIVSVKGEITLIGVKQGDAFRFTGNGRVAGKIGPCPFCVRVRKNVSATYAGGSWSVDL